MASKDDELIRYEIPIFDLNELTNYSWADGAEEEIHEHYLECDYPLPETLLSIELIEAESHVVFDLYNKINKTTNKVEAEELQFFKEEHTRTKKNMKTKEFKCSYIDCNRIFKSQIALKFHKLSHDDANKKRYKCDQCTKKFVTIKYMMMHKKYHIDVNCEICSSKFNAKSQLNNHMSQCHKKTVICKYCRFKVFTEKQLYEHINKCHSLHK